MAMWLDKAWKRFYANGGVSRVKAAFQRCGTLNAMDGSEDNIICGRRTRLFTGGGQCAHGHRFYVTFAYSFKLAGIMERALHALHFTRFYKNS